MSHAKEDLQIAREYWNQRILGWEAKRYGISRMLDPLSWPLRLRLSRAKSLLHSFLQDGDRLLELGCGSGGLAQALVLATAGKLPFFYKGVDISDRAISSASARNLGARFEFVAGDATSNAALSEGFHVTVFLGLVDWLNDEQLKLLFASLRSEVLLFSFSELRNSAFALPYALYRARTDRKLKGYGARTYTKEEICLLVERAGYSIRSLEPTDPLSPSRLVYARRMKKP